jgi:hypothetical protein
VRHDTSSSPFFLLSQAMFLIINWTLKLNYASFGRLLYTAVGPGRPPDHAAPTPRKSKKGGDALSSERDSPWRADAGGAEKAERALGANAAARGAAS